MIYSRRNKNRESNLYAGLENNNRGVILILALIFLTVLIALGISLAGLVIVQNNIAQRKIEREYGFQLSEAGLNYAKWRLAHDPENFSEETVMVSDPEGGTVGSFKVNFTAPGAGTIVTDIVSEGWYKDNYDLRRIVSARYGRRPFTFYAFLFDSPVWFGGNNVDGRVHSNEGIRMDATANSQVTSARETYTCTAIHGCSPQETKPGVWGTGGNQSLWKFPVNNIDFASVVTDLAILEDLTENQGVGLFLTKSGVSKGYNLHFQSNGTVDVYKVDKVDSPVTRYRWENNRWKRYRASLDIKNQTFLQTYALQENDLIFAQTDLWIEGTVNGRVTVVSASLPDISNNNTEVIISDNITYNAYDGTTVLGIIGQKNVLISLKVPDNLIIEAVLMAQKGFIGRDYYLSSSRSRPYNIRNSITTYGSMISKDFSDPEFRWVNGRGDTVGGFDKNFNSYDPYLMYAPPPYFPVTGDNGFISWEEKEIGE